MIHLFVEVTQTYEYDEEKIGGAVEDLHGIQSHVIAFTPVKWRPKNKCQTTVILAHTKRDG